MKIGRTSMLPQRTAGAAYRDTQQMATRRRAIAQADMERSQALAAHLAGIRDNHAYGVAQIVAQATIARLRKSI